MMKLGYNMAGTEARFEHWIDSLLNDITHMPFRYVEIGIAEGTTLLAVAEHLRSMDVVFQCTGYDLFPSPFFNADRFLMNSTFRTRIYKDEHHYVEDIKASVRGPVDVVLNVGTQYIGWSVDFVLCDACHGAPCVQRDFESVEQYVTTGGIIAFHDACEEDQGGPQNQHCGTGIAVREALRKLNLLPECTPYREGWKFLEEAPGNKALNGNGFVFVQKV